MQDIKIGRYDSGVPGWSGWVEDHEASWIIFLDEHGKPALYWPERDENGGVIGDPIKLAA